MLTLRAAAGLLQRADSIENCRALLAPLGFVTALPVSDALRATLRLDDRCDEAELTAGPGALRAFAIAARGEGDPRDLARELARRLDARAPHVLWLIVVTRLHPATVVIAIPRSGGQRSVALLAVERGEVTDGDAETLATLAAVPVVSAPDVVVHARWVEVLGRDALNRRFFRALERSVQMMAADAVGGHSAEARWDVALVCSSRLLFLAFLQARGWLDRDRGFLDRIFDRCLARGGGFHVRCLRPLFFGTLNTPARRRAAAARAFGEIPFLNGGLFAPVAAERGPRAPVIGDAALGRFLGDVLGGYRFTAREDRSTDAEVAVDPEMLGRAFESLMAARDRRASGTYYTPSALAAKVVDDALVAVLAGMLPGRAGDWVAALPRGEPLPADACTAIRATIPELTVLDPACGSGALLIRALDRLGGWIALAGDPRPADVIRRELLARCIFGIDRSPTAVWLCELRLWLSIAVECEASDPVRVPPLPNLDRNIFVGDALRAPIGMTCRTTCLPPGDDRSKRMAALRARYARASGAAKLAAAQALDRAERRAALESVERELATVRSRRCDIIAVRRGRDLFGERSTIRELQREAAALRGRAAALRRERRRLGDGGGLAFRVDAHFADVMARGGFDAVIGNPPWVRLHRIPPAERIALRARYAVLRDAAWSAGAAAAGAGNGFAGQADLSALFVERATDLLRPGGVLSLLLPVKLWTALAGGGVRRLLTDRTRLLALEDCSDAPELFDAVAYPSLLLAERADTPAAVKTETVFGVHRGAHVARWRGTPPSVALDASPGSPWLLLPPAVRTAFDRLRRAGPPLGTGPCGRPILGVKCGVNDAFLVQTIDEAVDGATVRVRDRSGRTGRVEAALIRPIIRGELAYAWSPARTAERIVWTHDRRGPLARLPELAAAWLGPHEARLAARTDARGRRPWWSLHRVDGARNDVARVVWADLSRAPRALFLEPGDPLVPLNTCYVLRCREPADAQAIAALLNSCLAGAWLRAVAEPARGGYHRLLAWTVAMLPLPDDWHRARSLLAALARSAADGAAPAAGDLLEVVLDAYRIRRRDVEALLEWHPQLER